MNTVDIDKRFADAHKKMFFDTVSLAIDNNADSYLVSVGYKTKNESNKTVKKLFKIYEQNDMQVDEDSARTLFGENNEELASRIINLVGERSEERKDFLRKTDNEEIDDEFMKRYCAYICNDVTFLDKLDVETRKQICTILLPEVNRLGKSKDEAMKNKIEELLNSKFTGNIFSILEDECEHRDKTLCISSRDAFAIYQGLNKNNPVVESEQRESNVVSIRSKQKTQGQRAA